MAKSKRVSRPSPLLRQIMGTAKPLSPEDLHELAARMWSEVTGGAGVVLVNGQEVKTASQTTQGKGGAALPSNE